MYVLSLLLFIIITVLLISLIVLENSDITDINTSSINYPKSLFNTNTTSKILTNCIIVLSLLFFIFSLILCHFNEGTNIKNIDISKFSKF
ncbi:preprotein translocase subunit SecG [Enterobacteriaceae endosymbiont of Neohaemonia nigricornis]|uniref:preprotein translocase subunit SecG n=1 Tax=Enterobacteriaceae endosymbiont of Neohaemonia nigricornis TaxID=2675792 RepID=UPI0014490495|nr:preprotein translocase subunit SecG [Enterobacteriaceae endosymbiont of Neohaemonia nigricornis]QJC30500.1 preprotein translocase subunit SecG [Enterobacteriaceae endosymbiont of Neohaemonia nigricornis]